MNVGKWVLKKLRGKKKPDQISNNPVFTNNFNPNIQFVYPSGPYSNGTPSDFIPGNTSHNVTYYINGNPHSMPTPSAVPSQPLIGSTIAPPTSIPQGLPSQPIISLAIEPTPRSYLPAPETSRAPQELSSQPIISSPIEHPTTNCVSTPETLSVSEDLPLIPVAPQQASSTEDISSQPLHVPLESVTSPVQPIENILIPPLPAIVEPRAQAVEWIKTTPEQAFALSERAVVASNRGFDNSPQWVMRAWFDDDLLPGVLSIVHETAHVPWGGHLYFVDEIEVCCASAESVRWVEARDGAVPPRAVRAGHTSDGERLYVGRAWQDGFLSPGKVHPSHKKLYISFRYAEISHDKYEVLCLA